MEIRTSILPIPGYPLAEKKAGNSASTYVEAVQSVEPVRKLSDVIEAEALLKHTKTRQGLHQELPEQRSRRALEAYSSLEQIQQRNYVSKVLGIDEYA